MCSYKLIYFDFRAIAEVCRLLFAQAGVQYEDVRIAREGEEWKNLKHDTPFGKLPLLEFDGEVLCQSKAIGRYLAKQFGLVGISALEEAQCDMIVDCLEDMTRPIWDIYYTKEEDKKAEITEKLLRDHLPVSYANLEKLLIRNKGGNDFFVGQQLTWADLTFINSASIVDDFFDFSLDAYPKLKQLREKVENIPNIKAWINERPNTEI